MLPRHLEQGATAEALGRAGVAEARAHGSNASHVVQADLGDAPILDADSPIFPGKSSNGASPQLPGH